MTVIDRVDHLPEARPETSGSPMRVRKRDGTLLWTWTPPQGAAGGDMVLTDNLLFVVVNTPDTRATYAVDRDSGRHVWFHPAGGDLALGADGTLFIVGDYGQLTALAVR